MEVLCAFYVLFGIGTCLDFSFVLFLVDLLNIGSLLVIFLLKKNDFPSLECRGNNQLEIYIISYAF